MAKTNDSLKANPEFAPHDAAKIQSAQLIMLCELIGLLIDKGAVTQGDVIARYERSSEELMKEPGGERAIQLADFIQNHVAVGRPPGGAVHLQSPSRSPRAIPQMEGTSSGAAAI
jgi:hypothetical protein